jgi:hypothetical protein
VTRNAIFWGKAFPGAMLYLFAVLVPLFGVAWWVSLPGAVPAPFDWRLVNPPLWDAIAALAFYFAALQSGVMSGPWFGRRLLPLIAVCFGAIAVKNSYQFHAAVAGALTILTLSIFCAWAGFLSNGSFRNAPAWGKAAMAVLGLFGLSVLSGWWNAGWQLISPPAPYSGEDLRIMKDGQPVMVTQQGQWMKKVVTLDNVELHPENKSAFSYEDFLQGTYLSLRFDRQFVQWRSARTYFSPMNGNNSTPVLWYFVNGPSRFARYGLLSRRFEVWLGPQGMAEATSLPSPGFNLLRKNFYFYGAETLLVCKDAIWCPKLNRNEVLKVYSLPEGEKLLGAGPIYEQTRSADQRFDFALDTDRNIQVRADDGALLFSTPQIPNLGNYERVQVFRTEDRSRYFLIYQGRYDRNPRPPQIFLELSASGEVVQRREVPPEPQEPWAWSLKVVWNAAMQPIGESLWSHALGGLYGALGIQEWTPVWKFAEPARARTLQLWGISLLFGAACAGAGQILFKRLGGGSRWAWTIFLIFFSYAGLLMLALLHEWPRRKRCAGCGGKRSLERADCGQCGAPWPAREPDGTEIFEAVR